MATIKIADLNAVRELSAQELSLTKGGCHEESYCCAPLVYVGDVDGVDNKEGSITGIGGDVTATGIGATFSKSFNDVVNGNKVIL